MFRFFAAVGFSFYSALVFSNLIPICAVNLFIIVSFLALFVSLVVKKIRATRILPIVFGSIFLAFCLYSLNYYTRIKPVENLGEGEFRVSGRIVELPDYGEEYDIHRYIFKVENVEGAESVKNFKLSLSSSAPLDADIYDKITANIHISPFDNFIENSQKKYYHSKGIYAQGFFYSYKAIDVKQEEGIKPLYYYVLKIRQSLISAVNVLFEKEQASLVNGILLGDKKSLSYETRRNFERIGLSHVLAVSGMHLTILTSILVELLKKIKIKKNILCSITIAFLIFFIALTGFTPSVLRAGIMVIIYFLGILLSKNPDSLNSLGLSIFLITLFNVNLAGNIGLLFSFLSVLSIIIFLPKLKNHVDKNLKIPFKKGKILGYFEEVILTSFSVFMFNLPVCLLYYEQISLIGIISNILILYPVSLMLLFCVILLFLYFVNSPAFIIAFFKIFCEITINYIISCSKLLASFRYACISADYLFVKIWVAISLVFFGIAFLVKNTEKSLKIASIISIILLIFSALLHEIFMKDTVTMLPFNSKGGCGLAILQNGKNFLILCNLSKMTERYISLNLDKMDIFNVDFMILPYYMQENIDIVNKLIKKYRPHKIVIREDTYTQNLNLENEHILTFKNSFNVSFDGNLDIILNSREDKNVFCCLHAHNRKILFCPYGGELPENFSQNKSDILILGSALSDIKKSNADQIILFTDKKESQILVEKFSNINIPTILSSNFYNLYINITKFGNLYIGRRI